MEQNESQNRGIIEGVIWKQILIFFFPILIGTFFQQMYNTVDAVILGQFAGKEALASVGGSVGQLVMLVINFFVGISSGASVLIAQAFGARDERRMHSVLHTSYAFSILGGLLIGVGGILLAPFLLNRMNTPEILMDMSLKYIRIYFAGLIFVFIYNIGASILRSLGDSRRPLYVLIVCCLVNTVLDLIFVVWFRMGVTGAALATVMAQGISALMVSWFLMHSVQGAPLNIREIRVESEPLKNILAIGMPTGIQSIMYGISNIIIQSALNLQGVDVMAAWTSYSKIDSIFWMVNGSFGVAVITFVGQNYGAGCWNRVRKGTMTCLGMAMGSAVILSAILMAAGSFLFGIFTGDVMVVAIGMRMMRIIAPTYVLFSIIEVLSGSLRAQGHTLVATIITLMGACVFRVIWVNFFCETGGMERIISCYPISWAGTAVAIVIYYIYKQKKILQEHQ